MTQVLLLNANFQPLKTVSLQRAISLILKDKIDILESVPDKKLRSPSVEIPYPSVIRLKKFVNVPKRRTVYSRRAIFSRDNYTCQFCGKKLSREDSTVDHLIPVEECKRLNIRASTFTNCTTSCAPCNRKKRNRRLEDSGMKFYDPNYTPKTPRVDYLVVSSDIPVEWKIYLKL